MPWKCLFCEVPIYNDDKLVPTRIGLVHAKCWADGIVEAAPAMFEYLRCRALAGDQEALEIMLPLITPEEFRLRRERAQAHSAHQSSFFMRNG